MSINELGKEGLKGSMKQKENALAFPAFVQNRGFPITMHGQI